MKKKKRISIRNLVEFIMKYGSIDNTISSNIKPIEGTRAHQMIQKSYDENYSAEVSLKYEFEHNNIKIRVEGRADGILIENDEIIIDEIKTTLKDVNSYNENINNLHLAQVKCYGYIYCFENKLDYITLQLTYYNIENASINYIRYKYSKDELEKDFLYLIEEYKKWIDLETNYIENRNNSIENMDFPYDNYRQGQRELAVYVYKSIIEGKKCLAQAPTGTGKTISTLFPTIKAMGQGHTSKIFYITAKTITREVCENTIGIMKNKGLNIKYTTITAKEKVCKMDEVNCNPIYCKYANGYFDRINNALKEILVSKNDYNRNTIEYLSEKYCLCPFELSLDLTLFSDVIICDYNYVFDPKVSLKRFFDNRKNDFTVLIDEAHNLVDRARNMYSASLSKKDFMELKKQIKGKDKKIENAINKINSYFIKIKKDIDIKIAKDLQNYIELDKEPLELYTLLRTFIEKVDEYLSFNNDKNEDLLNLYFDIYSFLTIGEFYDENFITLFSKKQNDIEVGINCIDPSKIIQNIMKKIKSTIIFSATLIPNEYFQHMLGMEEEDYFISLKSPFSVDNRKIIFGTNINTTYNKRIETCDEVVEYIKECVEVKNGNYMVFFPSYVYMKLVFDKMCLKYPNICCVVQENNMSEDEKEMFLNGFNDPSEETRVGFCVLGGHFSEGIDLTRDKLIGVIIIGVGMPQIGIERDLIKKYFDKNNNDGFDYAYTYPGFIKVLQAAGRCIRTTEDRGIIMLLDSRYNQKKYQYLFPREWFPNSIAKSSDDVKRICETFWTDSN